VRPRILPGTALLLFALACDRGPDVDAMRGAVGDVVSDHLAAVKETQTTLATKLEAIATKQTEIADAQAAMLAKLTALEQTVDEIRTDLAKAPAPTPTPTPTVAAGKPDPALVYKVEIDGAQKRGSDSALVTIVEWSDFQCPFCSRVAPTLEDLSKEYGSDLRIVFQHNPLSFHPRAKAAAIAAEAAGEQGKFWEMHDKLFANNKDLTDANFVAWAKDIGCSVKRFEDDLDDARISDRVDAQQKRGVALGARGTPAFFINGRYLSGAQPIDAFRRLIDEEKKKAESLVAAGTARDKVYETTIAAGRTSP
jgi:protein-disulfide isomerase